MLDFLIDKAFGSCYLLSFTVSCGRGYSSAYLGFLFDDFEEGYFSGSKIFGGDCNFSDGSPCNICLSESWPGLGEPKV